MRGVVSARLVLVFLLTLLLTACGGGGGTSDGWLGVHEPLRAAEAPYLDWTRESRYLEMRDGVRIAVDVYLPKHLEPGVRLPWILPQTSCPRTRAFRGPLNLFMDRPGPVVELFVTRGYAWIDVDARGSGASFGTRAPPRARH